MYHIIFIITSQAKNILNIFFGIQIHILYLMKMNLNLYGKTEIGYIIRTFRNDLHLNKRPHILTCGTFSLRAINLFCPEIVFGAYLSFLIACVRIINFTEPFTPSDNPVNVRYSFPASTMASRRSVSAFRSSPSRSAIF